MSDEEFRVPDGIEPLVGVRAWVVIVRRRWWARRGEFRLLSLNASLEWSPATPARAGCAAAAWRDIELHDPVEAPRRGCTCGLYAMFPEGFARSPVWCFGPRAIYGEVEAWGRIFRGPYGFRAEWARPRRLFLAPPPGRSELVPDGVSRHMFAQDELVEEMGRTYGAPVVPWPEGVCFPKAPQLWPLVLRPTTPPPASAHIHTPAPRDA